jgi:hypothetical protein
MVAEYFAPSYGFFYGEPMAFIAIVDPTNSNIG